MPKELSQHLLDTFEDALQSRNIQVYYQPVIRTLTRRVCSFEALARWHDPKYGTIQPNQFIGLLEEHRLIHRLDCHVIREVCAQIRRSIDEGFYPIPTSVNLSRLDFELCDIFDTVDRCVEEFMLPRSYLHIEITESMFADHPDMMHMVIDRFRGAGYQVWMDDFGSGYSSLNLLKDFTFDELKVDMEFLSSFHLRSRKILTSIIDMAKNIGLHTLVEGVETETQYEFLCDIGCEKAQGYLFGQPMPFNALLEHLRAIDVPLEEPRLREYYDQIGMINVLSPAPFMTYERRNNLRNARELNSIPLALAEQKADMVTLLFYNVSFEEALADTPFGSRLIREEQLGRPVPAAQLPPRFLSLLEEARQAGSARVYFVANSDYYEFRAQSVSRKEDCSCMLLRLENLSRNLDFRRISTLDAEMRHIFSIYEKIALFELAENRYTPLFVGRNESDAPVFGSLAEMIRSYGENDIFPEDLPAFTRFYDTSTVEERLLQSRSTHIAAYFRTRDLAGVYVWKQYVFVSCRPGAVFSLIRGAEGDIRSVRERFSVMYRPKPPEALTDGRLWKSLSQTGFVRFYWKDRNLRYVGASLGFLRYFGFDSMDEILGKTDEELGWHILAEHALNSELRVLKEGRPFEDRPISYIVGGTKRNHLVSAAPVYNEYGAIVGIVGSLRDYEPQADPSSAVPDFSRTDGLTGLLNTRGIAEELSLYCDMYYLRKIDFVRIHVSAEDFDSITQQYGHPYGERVITALGAALGRLCGNRAVLGRSRGHHFVILYQYGSPEDIPQLTSVIRNHASRMGREDGLIGGIYLSVGLCTFSECEDIYRQEQLADARLEEDHNRHISSRTDRSYAGELFRMYDHLPLAFAVYEVKSDPGTGTVDAVFYYVNARFALEQGKKPEDLIGQRVRDVFPGLEREWYDMAYKAAFLCQETVLDYIYFDCMKTHYRATASQIIRPGFCVFTYQPLDGPFANS